MCLQGQTLALLLLTIMMAGAAPVAKEHEPQEDQTVLQKLKAGLTASLRLAVSFYTEKSTQACRILVTMLLCSVPFVHSIQEKWSMSTSPSMRKSVSLLASPTSCYLSRTDQLWPAWTLNLWNHYWLLQELSSRTYANG